MRICPEFFQYKEREAAMKQPTPGQLALAQALRRDLHRHPELSGQEAWTKAHLMDFLRRHTALELADMGSWFFARCPGRGPGSIAFRADFDALPMEEQTSLPYRSQCPGAAHACGHDGHSAALALLALTLVPGMPARTVYLIFQHGEETGMGGKGCAAFLQKAGVDEVYAFHNMSGYPKGAVCIREGTMNCASQGMILRFTGVPAHASTPELGRNPAQAVARLVTALPGLAGQEGRRGLVLATVVQIDVGAPAFGLAAHTGRLLLTLRADFQEELDALSAALEAMARQEAARDGLALEISYADVFPANVNHPGPVRRVREAAGVLDLPVVEMPAPMRASEDFGWYLRACPGAMFLLGNGEGHPPIHAPGYDFPDALLEVACGMFQALI